MNTQFVFLVLFFIATFALVAAIVLVSSLYKVKRELEDLYNTIKNDNDVYKGG